MHYKLIQVRIPTELHKALLNKAQARGMNFSTFVRSSLIEMIGEKELTKAKPKYKPGDLRLIKVGGGEPEECIVLTNGNTVPVNMAAQDHNGDWVEITKILED